MVTSADLAVGLWALEHAALGGNAGAEAVLEHVAELELAADRRGLHAYRDEAAAYLVDVATVAAAKERERV